MTAHIEVSKHQNSLHSPLAFFVLDRNGCLTRVLQLGQQSNTGWTTEKKSSSNTGVALLGAPFSLPTVRLTGKMAWPHVQCSGFILPSYSVKSVHITSERCCLSSNTIAGGGLLFHGPSCIKAQLQICIFKDNYSASPTNN